MKKKKYKKPFQDSIFGVMDPGWCRINLILTLRWDNDPEMEYEPVDGILTCRWNIDPNGILK